MTTQKGDRMSNAPAAIHELTPQECLTLLRSHPVHVGRVALVRDGDPLILPVNYRLDGDTVVIRTAEDTALHQAAQGSMVAFEVDAVDPAWEDGWSVVIRGTASPVEDPDELDRVRQLPLRPWAGGERDLYVRIRPQRITGRRIA
jgi:nitroimidazol reductase NimA-like FMN-containing flavoprotein (pyridoxamine 5'-phosphate oxidase superfamily)